MFNKKEDQVFEYAFGDLNARESQIFEAGLLKDEVNAEEAKFLQSIKSDLVSFRDIPEMQYSKERLRDAILGQGLKPTRPGLPWLNLILAPGAAACVFALGYILMNGTSHKAPTLIGTPNVADASKSGGPKLPTQKLTKPEPIVAFNSKPKNSVEDVYTVPPDPSPAVGSRFIPEVAHYSVKKNIKHPKAPIIMVATNTAARTSTEIVGDAVSSAALVGGGMTGAAFDSEKDTLSDPSKPIVDTSNTLILIDKDQDSGVGAPVATEVNDTKNVIIGG